MDITLRFRSLCSSDLRFQPQQYWIGSKKNCLTLMSRWRANGNDAPSVTYDITAGIHLDEIISEGELFYGYTGSSYNEIVGAWENLH